MKFILVGLLSLAAMVAAECPEGGVWYVDRNTKEPCHTPCEVEGGGTCVLNCIPDLPDNWLCAGQCSCPST